MLAELLANTELYYCSHLNKIKYVMFEKKFS